MQRRALLLTMTLVGAAVLIGFGLTYALFTANADPVETNFMAGTLDLDGQRDMGDGIPGPMFYTSPAEGGTAPVFHPTGLWVPGAEHHRVLQIENIGQLDAWLTGVSATLQTGSGTDDLAEILDVHITTDEGGDDVIAAGKLTAFLEGVKSFADPIPCEVDDLTDLWFWVGMPRETGNDYQDTTCQITFKVHAVQMDYNPNP